MGKAIAPAEVTVYEQMLSVRRRAVLQSLGTAPASDPEVKHVATEDQAQISHDEFISSQINQLDYVQLRLIDEALDRIAVGEYGVCSSCEAVIPPKRLQAVPWAKYCVACQEQMDRPPETAPWMTASPHRLYRI